MKAPLAKLAGLVIALSPWGQTWGHVATPATPAAASSPAATPLHEIRTAAGEIFRGELIHADATRLVLRSLAAGEITFATAEVVCLPPPLVEAPPPPPSAWAAAEPAPSAPPPPPSVTPEPALEPGRWKRALEAGFTSQISTVSRRDYYLRGEVIFQATDRYQYRALVKYIYGEQAGEKSIDRLEGLLALRHDLAARWLLRGELAYRNDHLRDLDLETSGMFGVQYVLVRHPRFRLTLGPGAGFRYRETDTGLLEGTRFNTDFVEEASWTITDRVSLTQGAAYVYDTDEPEAYRVKNHAALGARVTDRVRANLRYEYEYDRARPAGPSRVDQRVFTTLGVEF